ncbi:Peroxisomal membrane 22 kDa (Mpv17/PMP22) family protein [Euphorbia peplus]|nr:Peroxisomal membrane 22 kDa (Mpv17/PMP22) family protein [Euphorbia peplus]
MEAFGGSNGGFWGWKWEFRSRKPINSQNNASKSSSDAVGGGGFRFPIQQAVTAGSLALTGDTIAQLTNKHSKPQSTPPPPHHSDHKDAAEVNLMKGMLLDHDWLRALRMTSYGFLFYGPGSYAWYRYLDHCLPQQSAKNLMLKVLLNQIVLGPCVIAVVFAWNNLWQGKVSQLPGKYKRDALPTLLYGFRFWIPVSALNFWVVPLQARVAFMSMGSIFWNFCLSSTMNK